MWVRGLKQISSGGSKYRTIVAPHVGAWIETYRNLCLQLSHQVAPHVGAWIETLRLTISETVKLVAPHVGAWIET